SALSPYVPPRPFSSPVHHLSNAPAAIAIYALSLHDALPISRSRLGDRERPHGLRPRGAELPPQGPLPDADAERAAGRSRRPRGRSEEHTSELQSRENLVCRLLLEKKKERMTQDERTGRLQRQ